MKIEKWAGHDIRFVEKDGEWWAVLKDVCNVLDLSNVSVVLKRIEEKHRKQVDPKQYLGSASNQPINIIDEFGIYRVVFLSRKKEALYFQEWIFNVISELRKQSGLEGFQMFRMLDKDFQKEQMKKLHDSLFEPSKRDYIKANTITDKAVSTMFGVPKMMKKETMTPEMLKEREQVLKDTVDLMAVKERFGLDISVSDTIYGRLH